MSDVNTSSAAAADEYGTTSEPSVTNARSAQATDSSGLRTDGSPNSPLPPLTLPPTQQSSRDDAEAGAHHRQLLTASPDSHTSPPRVARRSCAPPPGQYLTIPMLHFIASFFPSTVLPPDLRHIHEPKDVMATMPNSRPPHTYDVNSDVPRSPGYASVASPSPEGRSAQNVSVTPFRPSTSASSPPTTRVATTLAGVPPASVVQRALHEEKPPISVPLAFIAANPQCRRARELHGCALPPQGGLFLRVLGPESLALTAEAQLATRHASDLSRGWRDGAGGRLAPSSAAAATSATSGATTSLLASLYYTKRGHWLYDARLTDQGTAAAHRRRRVLDNFRNNDFDRRVDPSLPPRATASSPAAVLLVISRHTTVSSHPTDTTTKEGSPISQSTAVAAATAVSPILRRSPGLLPVYGARLAASPTTTTSPTVAAGDAAPSSTCATASDGQRGTPTTRHAPATGPLSESMEALARTTWWLHRRPALPLSLSLHGYSAEQTLRMMSDLGQSPSFEQPTSTSSADENDSAPDDDSGGEVEVDVHGDSDRDWVNRPNDRADGDASRPDFAGRALPVVWSAHSLHARSLLDDGDDECDRAAATRAPRARLTTSLAPPPPPPPQRRGQEQPRAAGHVKKSAPHAVFTGVTEIAIRSAGGGGIRLPLASQMPAEDPRSMSPSAAEAATDSKALTLLLAKYPELRSLSIHNANVTGDDLDTVSRACQNVTHLSLSMNPTLRSTRFLAPSVASSTATTSASASTATCAPSHATTTTAAIRTTPQADGPASVAVAALAVTEQAPSSTSSPHATALRPTAAMHMTERPEGDSAHARVTEGGVCRRAVTTEHVVSPHAGGRAVDTDSGERVSQGDDRGLTRVLSDASMPSTSRGWSFTLDTSEAAAVRDALLSPRERRQLALVVRPADVHMGGVRRGVGNLQGEERESRHGYPAVVAETTDERGDEYEAAAHAHAHRGHLSAAKTRQIGAQVPTRGRARSDDEADDAIANSDVDVRNAVDYGEEAAGIQRRRSVRGVDPVSLLRELTYSPARRNIREEVMRNAISAHTTDAVHSDGQAEARGTRDVEHHRDPSALTHAASPSSQRRPPASHARLRRSVPHRPPWATTLLELDLSFTAVHTDDVAHYLPRLRQLQVLWLEGCRDILSLEWVPQLPVLQELNLSRCDGLLPTSLWPLGQCARLERLSLARLSMMEDVSWLFSPPEPPAGAAGAAAGPGAAGRHAIAQANPAVGAAGVHAPPPLPQPEVAVFGAERFLRREVHGGVTAFTLLPRAASPPSAARTAVLPAAGEVTSTLAPAQAPSQTPPPLTRALRQLDLSFTGMTRQGLAAIRVVPFLTSLSLNGCRTLVDWHENANRNRDGARREQTVDARTIGDTLVSLEWLRALDLSGTGIRDGTLTAVVPLLVSSLHTLHLSSCRELTQPPAWLVEGDHRPSCTSTAHAHGSACVGDDAAHRDAATLFARTDGPGSDGLYAIDMPDCVALGPRAFAEGCFFASRVRASRERTSHLTNIARDRDAGTHNTEDSDEINQKGRVVPDAYCANGVTVVRLRGCDRVQDVLGLAPLCWVTELDLYHTAVTSETLVPALRSWQCLHTLALGSTGVVEFDGWLPRGHGQRTSDSSTGLPLSSSASRQPTHGHEPAPAPPPFLQTLRYLDLSHTRVTSDGIGFIAHCPQLTTLCMRRCRHLTHLRFLLLATTSEDSAMMSCTDTRESGTLTETAAGVCAIFSAPAARRRAALRELTLTDAVALTETSLHDVAHCAVRLRKLIVTNCSSAPGTALDTRPLHALVRSSLQELDISGSVSHAQQVCALLGLDEAGSTGTRTPTQTSSTASPTKPATPPGRTPSPRRPPLSVSPTKSVPDMRTSQTEVELEAEVDSHASPARSSTTAANVPVLQVLRVRGCPQSSSDLKNVLTVPSLRRRGFVNLEKIYL